MMAHTFKPCQKGILLHTFLWVSGDVLFSCGSQIVKDCGWMVEGLGFTLRNPGLHK